MAPSPASAQMSVCAVVVARKLAFSAVVVLPIMATALAQEPRDVPTFSSGTELVTVDAVMLDDHGRPVRGLTSQDFALAEDGKPQAIVSFEPFDRMTRYWNVRLCCRVGPGGCHTRASHRSGRAGCRIRLLESRVCYAMAEPGRPIGLGRGKRACKR